MILGQKLRHSVQVKKNQAPTTPQPKPPAENPRPNRQSFVSEYSACHRAVPPSASPAYSPPN